MNKVIGIVEIGSTNTKAYKYFEGKIVELGFKTIEFKKNYGQYSTIPLSDIEFLIEFINDVFDPDISIYVYATSVFRELDEGDFAIFEAKLKANSPIVSVNVVSAEMENELTVIGAINNVSVEGNVCVFVGGGGSTEISICKNGEITEMVNTNIGVTHIVNNFPTLSEDYSTIGIDDVTEYISKHLILPSQKAEYLILAGGDFLLRYINAQYPIKDNILFCSKSHPYTVSYEDNRKFEDKYFHQIPLSQMKQTTPDNPKWWNGTRAMCAFTNAVALSVGAKIIIPTKITMIGGIVSKLIKDN